MWLNSAQSASGGPGKKKQLVPIFVHRLGGGVRLNPLNPLGFATGIDISGVSNCHFVAPVCDGGFVMWDKPKT